MMPRPPRACLILPLALLLAGWTDPHPSPILNPRALHTPRLGQLQFRDRLGQTLRAFTYRATGFKNKEGPIWFIQHGRGRNAESYLRRVAPLAERYGVLALAMEFSEATHKAFHIGVGKGKPPRGPRFRPRQWGDPTRWTLAEPLHLFQAVRTALGSKVPGFHIYGHSGGGQFTHRLVTFFPSAPLLGAVAANAGWYTLPRASGKDDRFPFGLTGSPITSDGHLRRLFRAPLTVIAGSEDTGTSVTGKWVCGAPLCQQQGPHRVARSMNYISVARAQAKRLGVPLGWRHHIVPGVAHEGGRMGASAAFLLFENAKPCKPSMSGGVRLVFSELHISAGRKRGDTNRDGVLKDEEFVEILNAGSTPACLTGWSLHDKRGKRHVFPLGRALAAGEVIVVFGGGIPTGSFGGAQVQTVTVQKLGLTDRGDVLTLKDGADQVALKASWGDCAGIPCAEDHIKLRLRRAVSWARRGGKGAWQLHRRRGGTPYSPGRLLH